MLLLALLFLKSESDMDVVTRTRSFLADVLESRAGARGLVIAHSANRLAIEHLVTGEDLEKLIGRRDEWAPGWEYVIEPTVL